MALLLSTAEYFRISQVLLEEDLWPLLLVWILNSCIGKAVLSDSRLVNNFSLLIFRRMLERLAARDTILLVVALMGKASNGCGCSAPYTGWLAAVYCWEEEEDAPTSGRETLVLTVSLCECS